VDNKKPQEFIRDLWYMVVHANTVVVRSSLLDPLILAATLPVSLLLGEAEKSVISFCG